MPAIYATLADESVIAIPTWVIDNASFLRWAESEDGPDEVRMGYFNGTVWIDKTMEQLFHNEIKYAIAQAILNWNQVHQLGKYYGDGVVFTSPAAEFTTIPDGIFISREHLFDGTVIREKGKRSTKLTGSPDLVLEVISLSSVNKDLEFRTLYYEAGVREYWMVDSRFDTPVLQILKRGEAEFIETPAEDGWVYSDVLKGSFRFTYHVPMDEYHLDAEQR